MHRDRAARPRRRTASRSRSRRRPGRAAPGRGALRPRLCAMPRRRRAQGAPQDVPADDARRRPAERHGEGRHAGAGGRPQRRRTPRRRRIPRRHVARCRGRAGRRADVHGACPGVRPAPSARQGGLGRLAREPALHPRRGRRPAGVATAEAQDEVGVRLPECAARALAADGGDGRGVRRQPGRHGLFARQGDGLHPLDFPCERGSAHAGHDRRLGRRQRPGAPPRLFRRPDRTRVCGGRAHRRTRLVDQGR